MHVQSNQMQAHTVVPSPHHKVTLWRTVHAVKDVGAMCWIVTAQACVPAFECMCVSACAHTCPRVCLRITCCYQRLATRPRVCIFPADWPQSASPLPAPWLAAQTGAPANRHTSQNINIKKNKKSRVQKYALVSQRGDVLLLSYKNERLTALPHNVG